MGRTFKMNNDNLEVILQEWKTCVEMADSVSRRRDSNNKLYVSLNLAIIAGIVIVWNIKSVVLLLAGIIVSFNWLKSIDYYKALNEEKYKIINSIENALPIKPFSLEWDNLNSRPNYKDGTTIELLIPRVFMIIYLSILVYMAISKIRGEL